MSQSKSSSVSHWLPGLVISIIAILLLIRFSNWTEILQAVSHIKLIWLPPALVFFVFSIGLRAVGWMILLQKKAGFTRVFVTLNEGYLLNNIFPFRLGELGRAFILSETTGLSAFFVLSTIVIERTYDLAIAAGLLLATVPQVLAFEYSQPIAISVLVLMVLGLLIMFVLARYRVKITSKLEGFSFSSPVIRARILPWIGSLLAGFEVLSSLNQFLLSASMMVISWLFGAIELIFISQSFGVELEFWMVGFILGVISLGIAIPSAPAGLGVYEVAMVSAFSLLGLSSSSGLAIAFVSHLISITLTGLVGITGIFRDGESISGMYQKVRNVRIFNAN